MQATLEQNNTATTTTNLEAIRVLAAAHGLKLVPNNPTQPTVSKYGWIADIAASPQSRGKIREGLLKIGFAITDNIDDLKGANLLDIMTINGLASPERGKNSLRFFTLYNTPSLNQDWDVNIENSATYKQITDVIKRDSVRREYTAFLNNLRLGREIDAYCYLDELTSIINEGSRAKKKNS